MIFGVSETWLDDCVPNDEVQIPGFNIYRKDRNRRGGGVLLYVSEDVKVVRRQELELEAVKHYGLR